MKSRSTSSATLTRRGAPQRVIDAILAAAARDGRVGQRAMRA